jgi:LPS-assembly protein
MVAIRKLRALPRYLEAISGQALLAVSLAAILAAPSDAIAATQETAPPLGILIVPEGEVPPELTVVPAPGQNETRPLGILLGPNAAAPTVAPAMPAAPFQPQPQALPAPAPAVHVPAPGNSSQRPLGVLLEEPQPYHPPTQTAAPRSASLPAFDPAPTMPRVALPTAPGASAERPLGTLISPATEGVAGTNISAPTVAAPAPVQPIAPTAATAETAPQKPVPPATEARDSPPVRLVADEMSFDRDKEIVTASGNVQITYANRTLVADQVTYNQNDDVATAIGHVALRDATGERMFGDRMDISGDLKDAVVYNIGLILQDRSRIAGTGARHSAGRVTELSKGVYSPCEPCAKDPNSPPLWQIKAVKVIHDKEEKIVQYRDAWIEMFGYPVAYTPYFRHPDPTVKRKSGFLFPRLGSSSDFGFVLETPYFWAISDYEDATIRPIIMTDTAPVLATQYRKRSLKGELQLDGSVTTNGHDYQTERGENGMRGHVLAKGRYDINRTWRWGFDLQRATDDTYMRRYGFTSPASLDSQLFVEGFRRNNYIAARTQVFQGLQETDSVDASPIVLPLIDYNHVGDRDRLGGRFKFDFNFLALTRAAGTDTRRIAMHPRWERGFNDSLGSVYTFKTGLNADFYHVNSLSRTGNKDDFDGVSYRMFPFAGLEWRMPFVKTQGSVHQILEPIVSAGIAPNGGNSDKIPNEDSTDFELDETNVFSYNRFTGIDRVEGGPRINYGLKWGLYGGSGGSTTAFIGQTFRPREDSTFASGSGLEEKFSDLVAAVSVSPGTYLSALYRTRVATDNFSPNRNEVQLSAGVPAFRVSGNYVFLASQAGSEFGGREELSLSASSKITRNWITSFSGVRDMTSNEMRTANLSAVYEDECTIFTTRISRTFYEDRDLKPTDAITFLLTLKTLGEVKTGANLTSN